MPDFKRALQDEIRKILRDATELTEEQTKIVDLQFVFSNKEMIKLLKKRATALNKTKMDKVHRYESKMDKLVLKNLKELQTPNKFFCTFESAYASHKLLSLNGLMFQGYPLKF